MIERHPLQPFLPANAKVLFLGSFPPPKKRWCMEFFYTSSRAYPLAFEKKVEAYRRMFEEVFLMI